MRPILAKTPHAILSLAFIYLAACNFDPLWMMRSESRETLTAGHQCRPGDSPEHQYSSQSSNAVAGLAQSDSNSLIRSGPSSCRKEILRDARTPASHRLQLLPPSTAPPKRARA